MTAPLISTRPCSCGRVLLSCKHSTSFSYFAVAKSTRDSFRSWTILRRRVRFATKARESVAGNCFEFEFDVWRTRRGATRALPTTARTGLKSWLVSLVYYTGQVCCLMVREPNLYSEFILWFWNKFLWTALVLSRNDKNNVFYRSVFKLEYIFMLYYFYNICITYFC